MNPFGLMPAGVTLEDLVFWTTAAATLAVCVAVWHALLARDPVAARLRAMERRRAALRAGLAAPAGHRQRQIPHAGLARAVADRLRLLRSNHATKAGLALARAGIRSKDAVAVYVVCRLILPPAFAVLFLVAVGWLKLLPVPPQLVLPVSLAFTVLGYFAPAIYLKNAADKRRDAIRKGLPDGIDLMVICAECGLSLDATLDRVAREMVATVPELGDEFGLCAAELSFLPERRAALDNLAARTDLAALRGVVNTLLQTEKYGTPLADSLRVLAAEFRNDRMMRAEEKAARLPATLTVPMIVFILPTLMIVLMGPAILQVLDLLARR